MIHQSPFVKVNQWGTHVAAPAFTPSSYILLQAITSTPIYTMEVNCSSKENWKIQRKAMYHFFEGVQGNFLSCGLWIGAQVWR